jgi:hypothetical protein
MREQLPADLLEERLFERDGFVLGAERFFLKFLQLVCDIPLAVCSSLLSRPTGGSFVAMEVGDFDIVAEDFIEADTKRGNVAFVRQARLIPGEPLAGIRTDVAQAVEFGVVTIFDHAAFAKVRGGIGLDGANEKFRLPGDEAPQSLQFRRNVSCTR